MPKELTFYRDKGENFKCNAVIEGAEAKDSTVRLCLEFSDRKNMYFNGKINSKGEISVNVPALRGVSLNEGKVILEIIADNIYFKPFESTFKIKEAVKVVISEEQPIMEEIEEPNGKPKVSISFDDEKPVVPLKESATPKKQTHAKKQTPPKPSMELKTDGEFVSLRDFMK
jgi:hypothetical protein